MPKYIHYVEPYFGAGSVLFQNNPDGISEVVNDIDGELANFWMVLRCEIRYPLLQKVLALTPFSEDVYKQACTSQFQTSVDRAAHFFIRNRQSRQALEKDFATITRNRTRRGMNEQVASWLSAIEGLSEIHARLRRVLILNRDALEVIRQQDGPHTFFYIDPPYLPETRTACAAYAHEMTKQDHFNLLSLLQTIQGKFILSGYWNEMYHAFALASGWLQADIPIDNKSGGGRTKQPRIETLWMNYNPENPT